MERLNKVASRKTVRLTHYGRKSGKPHEVTIWFAVEGDKVYVGTVNVDRQWVKNVQARPKVQLLIGGERFDGEARFLSGPEERSNVQRLMWRKYWMFFPILAAGKVLIAAGVMKDRSGWFEVKLGS